jgi:hypothetical protein
MPLPAKEVALKLPGNLNRMDQAMRRDYVTAEHWWSEYES